MTNIEEVSDTEDWTPIEILGPLPMGVAGALMNMIGTAWPEAVISTRSRYGIALSMKIPKETPELLDEEFAKEIRRQADEGAGDFIGFRDGWVAFAPPEELCLHLGNVAHSIFTAHEPEAVNHVEWQVTTGKEPSDPGYVLSIAKSRGQTPMAMHKAAKSEVERLTALLEKHGIDPQEAT